MTKNQKTNQRYIFPKWSNRIPLLIALSGLFVVGFVIYVFYYWFSPKHLEVGYAPKQPIPYSHRLHVSELGLDCRYCHSEVERQGHSNIPTSEVCMNCHTQIKTDSPHIKKIKESYDTGEPIEWVKVHMLPDYAYFNHSRHVNSGVSCVSCHGRIDQMEVVRQVEPLSMSWCLECHRNPDPHIRPKSEVTNLSWEPNVDALELGRKLVKEYGINPREDCSTCHR